jgi:mono/diheme cytochrome c family protein
MVFLTAIVGLAGCAYGFGEHVVTTPLPESSGPPLDQPGRGAEIFAESCAGCHGEQGEGIEGRPAVRGEKALPRDPPEGAKARTSKFETPLDVFTFLKSDMPPIAPGSLSDEQYWSLVAFQLKGSGVKLPPGDLTEANAATIKLHP